MLIAMATYATESNGREEMCLEALASLLDTVCQRHRIVISDNGSSERVRSFLRTITGGVVSVLLNDENIGTARAINKAWWFRKSGEHCVKMDDDVIVYSKTWADEIEEVFALAPRIGICGLKRKDLDECPTSSNPDYRSRLIMLPHQKGQRWVVVEEVKHVMGTCQGYSSALLDQIGFLDQMQDQGNIYGFDDSLASVRAHVAGFSTVFLPHVPIDHIDPGNSQWAEKKRVHAGEWIPKFLQRKKEYETRTRPVRYEDKQ